jgi:hypothetical protein
VLAVPAALRRLKYNPLLCLMSAAPVYGCLPFSNDTPVASICPPPLPRSFSRFAPYLASPSPLSSFRLACAALRSSSLVWPVGNSYHRELLPLRRSITIISRLSPAWRFAGSPSLSPPARPASGGCRYAPFFICFPPRPRFAGEPVYTGSLRSPVRCGLRPCVSPNLFE